MLKITRYDTFVTDPWQDWDTVWLRQVQREARWLCIRVAGLFHHDRAAGPLTGDAPLMRSWQAAMKRVLGPRRFGTAFTFVQFRHLPARGNPLLRGCAFDHGISRLRNWPATLPLCLRLGYLLTLLRAETHLPILLHVEDFSARWALDSGITPDVWVMDNPMVGREEAAERWPDLLDRPGLVRRSRIELFDTYWRSSMHLMPEELLGANLPLSGTHGRWPSRLAMRPLKKVIGYAVGEPRQEPTHSAGLSGCGMRMCKRDRGRPRETTRGERPFIADQSHTVISWVDPIASRLPRSG